MRVFKQCKLAFLVVLLAVAAGTFVFHADAQTTRRKTPPKPLATPMLTGAEIISRAADQSDEPAEVVTPPKNKNPVDSADNTSAHVKELSARVKKLEATPKSDYDDKQKRLLMNLDILTRSEQRAETLRKSLFDMIEKESAVKSKLDQIENDVRPEMIERTLQLSGSMRPEEIREMRRKNLIAEKANLQALLTEIQSTRSNLAANVQKADALVEKLRAKLEKDIDDSLLKDDNDDKDQ